MAVIRASQEAYKRILKEAAVDGLGIELGLDRLLAELDLRIEELEAELKGLDLVTKDMKRENDCLYDFLKMACDKLGVVVPKEVRRGGGDEG